MPESVRGRDPATNLRTALAMADGGVAIMREHLRRTNPEATEDELSSMIHDWLDQQARAKIGAWAGAPGRWPRPRR